LSREATIKNTAALIYRVTGQVTACLPWMLEGFRGYLVMENIFLEKTSVRLLH
jgi:hypothetical protein